MLKVAQNTRKKFAKILLWSILVLESVGLLVPGAHNWFVANNIYVLSVFCLLVYLLRPIIEQDEAFAAADESAFHLIPADDKYASKVADSCKLLCDSRIEEVAKGTMSFQWKNAYFHFLTPLLSEANAIQAVDMTPIAGWQSQQQIDYIHAHNPQATVKVRIRIFDPEEVCQNREAFLAYIAIMEAARIELLFVERTKFCQTNGKKGTIPITPRGFLLLDRDQALATVASHQSHTPYQTFGRISFSHTKEGKRDIEKYVRRFKMIKKEAISQKAFIEQFDLDSSVNTPVRRLKQKPGVTIQLFRFVKKALSAAAGILG